MQSQLDSLLQKRMDRKNFLKHVGLGMVALTGVTAFIKAITPGLDKSLPQTGGYGVSAYGGDRQASKPDKI